MKYVINLFFVLLISTLLAGCFHAEVATDQQQGAQVHEIDWHHGLINGLVMLEEVDATEYCPQGVSKVETRLSFLNQVAAFATGGIYSPMSVRITCAAGGEVMEEGETREFFIFMDREAQEYELVPID